MGALHRTQVAVSLGKNRVTRDPGTPLLSCSSLLVEPPPGQAHMQQLHEAAKTMCKEKQIEPYMKIFLDPRFQKNYEAVYDKDGWVEEAWVSFIKAKQKKGEPGYRQGEWGLLMERLVDSVHRFSKKPIVVVNFGDIPIETLDPDRFPRLVVLTAP